MTEQKPPDRAIREAAAAGLKPEDGFIWDRAIYLGCMGYGWKRICKILGLQEPRPA